MKIIQHHWVFCKVFFPLKQSFASNLNLIPYASKVTKLMELISKFYIKLTFSIFHEWRKEELEIYSVQFMQMISTSGDTILKSNQLLRSFIFPKRLRNLWSRKIQFFTIQFTTYSCSCFVGVASLSEPSWASHLNKNFHPNITFVSKNVVKGGSFCFLGSKLVDYVSKCFQPAARDNNFRLFDYDLVFVSILVNINGINFCQISTTKGHRMLFELRH